MMSLFGAEGRRGRGALGAVVFAVCAGAAGGGACDEPVYVSTMMEPYIPDFGHCSFREGRRALRSSGTIVWTNEQGWIDEDSGGPAGRLPGPDDVVIVAPGTTVTVNAGSQPANSAKAHTIVVEAGGSLALLDTADRMLEVGTIFVKPGGRLEIGTPEDPFEHRAEVVFRNQPFHPDDFMQFGTGLVVMGEISVCGEALRRPWVRTAPFNIGSEVHEWPKAGLSEFRVESSVGPHPEGRGWRPGDELVLPDSRQLGFSPEDFPSEIIFPEELYPGSGESALERHWERATVTGISPGERRIHLAEPLRYDHPGAMRWTFDPDNPVEEVASRPHVANLTRNIVFRSEHVTRDEAIANEGSLSAWVRGHVMFTARADVDVRWASFRSLGRTRSARLDTGVERGFSRPIVCGHQQNAWVTEGGPYNQIGRYPVHFHHCAGPEREPGREVEFCPCDVEDGATDSRYGPQFRLIGCVVDGGEEGPINEAPHVIAQPKHHDGREFPGGVDPMLGTPYEGRYEPIERRPAMEEITIQWGIAVHGSHYGLIRDNIVYNVGGAGIVTEDGSESFNCFDGNLVFRVNRGVIAGSTSREVDQVAHHCPTSWDSGLAMVGTGFWFHGTNNYVRNNVASGAWSALFTYFPQRLPEQQAIPHYPGEMPPSRLAPLSASNPDEGLNFGRRTSIFPVREFSGNEGYGASLHGLDLWSIGTDDDHLLFDLGESLIEDATFWHFSQTGVFLNKTSKVRFDRLRLWGDEDWIDRNSGGRSSSAPANGIEWDILYPNRHLRVEDSEVQGVFSAAPAHTAFLAPYHVRDLREVNVSLNPDINPLASILSTIDRGWGSQVYQSCRFRCQQALVFVPFYGTRHPYATFAARWFGVRDCRFAYPDPESMRSDEPAAHIVMDFDASAFNAVRPTTLTRPEFVFVEDFQGNPDDDFFVHYMQQVDAYTVPPSVVEANGTRDTPTFEGNDMVRPLNRPFWGADQPGFTNTELEAVGEWPVAGVSVSRAYARRDVIGMVAGLEPPAPEDLDAPTIFLPGYAGTSYENTYGDPALTLRPANGPGLWEVELRWFTNERCDASVVLDRHVDGGWVTENFGSGVGYAHDHRVTLGGLRPDTRYRYTIASRTDPFDTGSVRHATRSAEFVTPEHGTPAPAGQVIEHITEPEDADGYRLRESGCFGACDMVGTGQTAAVIWWKTSVPTTSRVIYGREGELDGDTGVDDRMTTDHWVFLTGLEPGTEYQYVIVSTSAQTMGSGEAVWVYPEEGFGRFETLAEHEFNAAPPVEGAPREAMDLLVAIIEAISTGAYDPELDLDQDGDVDQDDLELLTREIESA